MKGTQTISRQEDCTIPTTQWHFKIQTKEPVSNMSSQTLLIAFRETSEESSQMLEKQEIIQWNEQGTPQSRRVSLAKMDLGDDQLEKVIGLIPEIVLKGILTIDLSHNRLTAKGLDHLLSQPLDALYDLNISFNTIDRIVPDQIEKLPSLVHIIAEHNQLTAQYILDVSSYYPNVLKIKLHKNSSYMYMESLANKQFPTIVHLDLSSNLLTDKELKILAAARFPKLQNIDLSDNSFTSESIRKVAWNNYQNLKALNLSNCKLDDACIVSLSEQFTISHGKVHSSLRELNLSHNILTEKGHHALQQMYIPNLQNLWLHDSALSVEDQNKKHAISLYADTIRNFFRTTVYAELVSVAHSALESSFSFFQQLLTSHIFSALEGSSNTEVSLIAERIMQGVSEAQAFVALEVSSVAEESALLAQGLAQNISQQSFSHHEGSASAEQNPDESYCEKLCQETLLASQLNTVLEDTASPSSVAFSIFPQHASIERRRRHQLLHNATHSSSEGAIAAQSPSDLGSVTAASFLHIKNA